MQWTIRLSLDAAKQFSKLSREQREMLASSIERMRRDPFQGDVKPLQGKKWKGRYRKRIGWYRIIFIPFHSGQIVEISQILLRAENTYR